MISKIKLNKIKRKDKKLHKKYCSKYGKYTVPVLPAVKRIIVIGDIHGDLKILIEILIKAKLIKKIKIDPVTILKKIRWIGKKTVIVQVGDQVDRCRPKSYKCDDPRATENDEHSDILIMKIFNELHRQAVKVGGAVYSLIGNHEIMNILGNFNYVSYEGLIQFADYKDEQVDFSKMYPEMTTVERGKIARQHAFKPGNEYSKMMACTRFPALIIGDYLFVHAGITPVFMRKTGIKTREDLISLNYHIRKFLLGLINKDSISHIIDSHDYSLFWTRILGNISPNEDTEYCVNELEHVLEAFRVNQIIVGHTPQFHKNKSGINTACKNGKKGITRVDIGASGAFDGFGGEIFRRPQVLEILNNEELNIIEL